jgi:hypothetical protein
MIRFYEAKRFDSDFDVVSDKYRHLFVYYLKDELSYEDVNDGIFYELSKKDLHNLLDLTSSKAYVFRHTDLDKWFSKYGSDYYIKKVGDNRYTYYSNINGVEAVTEAGRPAIMDIYLKDACRMLSDVIRELDSLKIEKFFVKL